MDTLTIPQHYAGTTRYNFPAEFQAELRLEQIAAEVKATQYAEHSARELIEYVKVSTAMAARKPVPIREYPISGDALAKMKAGLIDAE